VIVHGDVPRCSDPSACSERYSQELLALHVVVTCPITPVLYLVPGYIVPMSRRQAEKFPLALGHREPVRDALQHIEPRHSPGTPDYLTDSALAETGSRSDSRLTDSPGAGFAEQTANVTLVKRLLHGCRAPERQREPDHLCRLIAHRNPSWKSRIQKEIVSDSTHIMTARTSLP
jgi:hypothetical protein